jgi:hypothetical protein
LTTAGPREGAIPLFFRITGGDDDAGYETEAESKKSHARIQGGRTQERFRPQGEKPQAGDCDCDVRIRSVEAAQQGQLSAKCECSSPAVGPLIELRLLPDPAARPAVADANQLELAILNLAINARDAMSEGGRLTIATGRQNTPDRSGDGGDELGPGRYVVISVADTGSGMPPEVLARAMEPFFTTKGIEQGTGLGLSQVYGIARQSGGDVRIESSAGRGTTVRILLREAGRAARPDGNTAIDPSSLSQLDQGPLGSVLVDDDEDVRGIFVAGLEAYGYRVYEAADGPAALHMLEQGMTMDVAVVDFAMPRMNGGALARAARRLQPGLPIVFASG